jgi:hypothetical protein
MNMTAERGPQAANSWRSSRTLLRLEGIRYTLKVDGQTVDEELSVQVRPPSLELKREYNSLKIEADNDNNELESAAD